MLDRSDLGNMLREYTDGVAEILGDKLKQVILYGSYARGNHNDCSDVDIMLLVDLSDSEISEIRYDISGLAFDLSLEYQIMISTVIKNYEHFDKWLSAVPFYQAVKGHGVVVNG